jgi:transcriptional regulator, carD family
MLTKARQILSSELALARDIDKTAAAARLDEVLAEGYDESLAIADDLPEEDTEQE